MDNQKITFLTITLNCMVAGIIAGALFAIFLSALVLFIAGTGNTNLSEKQHDSDPVITQQHPYGVPGLDSDSLPTTSSHISHIQWPRRHIQGKDNTRTMML